MMPYTLKKSKLHLKFWIKLILLKLLIPNKSVYEWMHNLVYPNYTDL